MHADRYRRRGGKRSDRPGAFYPFHWHWKTLRRLFEWPQREMDDAEFVGQIIERTGAWLL